MPKNARKKTLPKKPASVPILYRLPATDTAALDAIAQNLGHTRSSLSRLVLRQWLAGQSSQPSR